MAENTEQYTPDDEHFLNVYMAGRSEFGPGCPDEAEMREDWTTWLTAHDARVKAEATVEVEALRAERDAVEAREGHHLLCIRNRMQEAADARAERDVALARIEKVRALHGEVTVYELESVNGTWVYDEDDERKIIRRLCAECSSEDVLRAVEDCEWMEDWGYEHEADFPCPTIRALDGGEEGA